MQPHDIYNTSSNIAYEARTPPNPDAVHVPSSSLGHCHAASSCCSCGVLRLLDMYIYRSTYMGS